MISLYFNMLVFITLLIKEICLKDALTEKQSRTFLISLELFLQPYFGRMKFKIKVEFSEE